MFYLSNIFSVVVLPLLPCYVIDDFSHKEGHRYSATTTNQKPTNTIVTPKMIFTLLESFMFDKFQLEQPVEGLMFGQCRTVQQRDCFHFYFSG